MSTATTAALRLLGITDDEIAAMKNRWPAGVPKDCSKWNWYDKRCLPIFAANCLPREFDQDEIDDLLFENAQIERYVETGKDWIQL